MAELKPRTRIEASATVELSESELRALDALMGYGTDPFLEVFYEKMGRSYLEPHELGLRDLFRTLKPVVSRALRDVDDARKFIKQNGMSG